MRRVPPVDPPARSALWSRRCGLIGLAAALGAVVASHAGWLHAPAALALLGLALLLALCAALLSVAAAVVIWRTGRPGVAALLSGLALAGLLLGGPAAIAAGAWRLPLISDVSTDLTDPPRFTATPAALAAREGAIHEPATPETRRAQEAAYPDVQPALLDVPPADAYVAVLHLVKARHWRIVASHAPEHAAAAAGSLEAVARTTVMGFREDVAIRIAPQSGERSRVDMRSASRFGRGDLGSNAARILSFLADLEEAVSSE